MPFGAAWSRNPSRSSRLEGEPPIAQVGYPTGGAAWPILALIIDFLKPGELSKDGSLFLAGMACLGVPPMFQIEYTMMEESVEESCHARSCDLG